MFALHAAVENANKDGRVALMLYTIPNYPSPEIYQKTLEILYKTPEVTIVESTFPVTSKYSEYANQFIQAAHQQAAKYESKETGIDNFQAFKKTSICVLYQQTFDELGFENILKKIQGKIDGILFEWEIEDIASYAPLAKEYDIELIQCTYPEMTAVEMDTYIGLTDSKPLIYLVSASMTGAELLTNEELIDCIKETKKHRPKSKVMAGFGVRNADDIKTLSQLEGLDGVIIGTAFLEKMAQGIDAVEEYLHHIIPALNKID